MTHLLMLMIFYRTQHDVHVHFFTAPCTQLPEDPKYPQSRINAHSNLRGAEWELEKEIERLKQFLDRMK